MVLPSLWYTFDILESSRDRRPGLLLQAVCGREGFGSLQSHVTGVRYDRSEISGRYLKSAQLEEAWLEA